MFYSVIIPCYNSEKTILRALESIKNQTFKEYEIIVVDDGSIDLTSACVKEFCENENLKFKYIYQENSGPSVARNKAVASASGEFLAFLDADDAWHKDKLKIQHDKILELNAKFISVNFIYDNFDILTNEIEISKYNFNSFLFSNKTSTPCTVVSRELFNEVGGFPEMQRYSEDYNLWLKISYVESLYKIQLPLVKLHKHSYGQTGLSANLIQMEKYELKNYVELYKTDKINLISLLFFGSISIVKFVRRLVLVMFR